MTGRTTKRRRYAGLERSLQGFLAPGEHLQHQCTALVSDDHAALLLGRQGELVSTLISNEALYVLHNSRRPPEATRISFDQVKRYEQTSPKTILIETYGDEGFVMAPQSAMMQRTTRKFSEALAAWLPNRVVGAFRVVLLPDGRGGTLFQLRPGPGEPQGEWSWSYSPDVTVLGIDSPALRQEAHHQTSEIINRVGITPPA
ncbi:hypothetical protein [Streptomyces sp. NPDC058548]|uniref:hypothetical protein n=1 Tax=Streptomyces sp. NPDC058548 TaxID=3346545 RepID=UPI0036695DE3